MKSDWEIMEILEAFDLTRSFRDAGELAGCSPNTVAHWVGVRDGGAVPVASGQGLLIDPYLDKVEEWVESSKGKIRADVAHDKLVVLGYPPVRGAPPAGRWPQRRRLIGTGGGGFIGRG